MQTGFSQAFAVCVALIASMAYGQTPVYESLSDSGSGNGDTYETLPSVIQEVLPPTRASSDSPAAFVPPIVSSGSSPSLTLQDESLQDPRSAVQSQGFSANFQLGDDAGSLGDDDESIWLSNPRRPGRCDTGSAGLYAGAAVMFFKPHFKEAFSYSRTDLQTGQQTLVPFEYDFSATPRVWLGIDGRCGAGVQASFWLFDQDGAGSQNTADGLTLLGAHATTVIFPANIFAINPGETLITSDSLWTETINVCGTLEMDYGGVSVQGGAGVRYAGFRQNYAAAVVDDEGQSIAGINWQRRFYGLGPTVFVDGRKQLGCSRFSAFMHGGGALLFGSKSIDRTVFGRQNGQPGKPDLDAQRRR